MPDFSDFTRQAITEKSVFLQKNKKANPGFLICFSLGNSASLTKKLTLGNFGHMDFLASEWLSGAVQAHTQNKKIGKMAKIF